MSTTSYECKRCRYYTKKATGVIFPRCALSKYVEQIKEFTVSEQLYYYLTWTNKMQVIDGEFIEYTLLRYNQIQYIAIFNSELHDKSTNDILYVVSILNNDSSPFKWTMDGFMTVNQIFNVYNLNKKDLPKGSRFKHNYFESDMNSHHNELTTFRPNIFIADIKTVRCVHSQKYKSKKNSDNKEQFCDVNELNVAIKQSIDNICNNNLSLIFILKIDIKKARIHCEPLIPIKLPNESKWMALSYEIYNNKSSAVLNSLYIDPKDIINKSSLIHPNNIYQYQWLKCIESTNIDNNKENKDNKDDIDKNIDITKILQQRLNEALEREKMWISMVQTKDVQIEQMKTWINNTMITTQQAQNISISTPILLYNVPITPYSVISTPSTSLTPNISTFASYPVPMNNVYNPSISISINKNNNINHHNNMRPTLQKANTY